MSDNERKIINHSITRLLSRREHSQVEIINKLLLKGLDESLIRQQLTLFVEKDIQSDVRFVESFIRSKVQKGQGKQRIEMALKQHNIDENVIAQGFAENFQDFNQIALHVYRKKYADKPIVDWQDKQKRMRFLQYRGFNTAQINYVLKQIS
ncbi:regulatory protein RecX [Aliiglaciecola litoralis]|uniref:Regulatory protein RecX n=1 Tax=Aliiglaciecola litoralis TaxID=582857 RepID=A0ABN1LLX4_9ALTE